jgi:hypothetical protein
MQHPSSVPRGRRAAIWRSIVPSCCPVAQIRHIPFVRFLPEVPGITTCIVAPTRIQGAQTRGSTHASCKHTPGTLATPDSSSQPSMGRTRIQISPSPRPIGHRESGWPRVGCGRLEPSTCGPWNTCGPCSGCSRSRSLVPLAQGAGRFPRGQYRERLLQITRTHINSHVGNAKVCV